MTYIIFCNTKFYKVRKLEIYNMARDEKYARYLTDCAKKATQAMEEKQGTHESLVREVIRQYEVMQRVYSITQGERESLRKTEHLKFTG